MVRYEIGPWEGGQKNEHTDRHTDRQRLANYNIDTREMAPFGGLSLALRGWEAKKLNNCLKEHLSDRHLSVRQTPVGRTPVGRTFLNSLKKGSVY